MQVEWGVFRHGRDALSAFVAALGWSRYSYVEFVGDERFAALKRCHENAFSYFQGVPKEVLYDNMKTVIQQRNAYGKGLHRFHSGLWELAKQTGFTPRMCLRRILTYTWLQRSMRGWTGSGTGWSPGSRCGMILTSRQPAVPRSLMNAVEALDRLAVLRGRFIDHFLHIKRAELERFLAHVTDCEHREYFEMY